MFSTETVLKWKWDHVTPLPKTLLCLPVLLSKSPNPCGFSRRPSVIWPSVTSRNSLPSILVPCSSHTELLAVPWIYQTYFSLTLHLLCLWPGRTFLLLLTDELLHLLSGLYSECLLREALLITDQTLFRIATILLVSSVLYFSPQYLISFDTLYVWLFG